MAWRYREGVLRALATEPFADLPPGIDPAWLLGELRAVDG